MLFRSFTNRAEPLIGAPIEVPVEAPVEVPVEVPVEALPLVAPAPKPVGGTIPQQAIRIVRGFPRQPTPVAVEPEVRELPVTVERPSQDDVARALWVIFNRTENPADFVRADEAMRAVRRAHGGVVDHALRVAREHHADGEAVGQTTHRRMRDTLANIDPERAKDQPVMDPATMGEAWDRARRNYQN